ncbi:MAG: CrcB family protein [Pseudomonadota bacterium]
MWMTLFSVALGGALGSVLRYGFGLWLTFPAGTLTVNVLGSFLIGTVSAWAAGRSLAPLLVFGLLGGFTTFSAFSLDVLRLAEAGRLAFAGAYAVASVALSLLACGFGLWLARGLA